MVWVVHDGHYTLTCTVDTFSSCCEWFMTVTILWLVLSTCSVHGVGGGQYAGHSTLTCTVHMFSSWCGWWPTWRSQYFDLYCRHVQFMLWVVHDGHYTLTCTVDTFSSCCEWFMTVTILWLVLSTCSVHGVDGGQYDGHNTLTCTVHMFSSWCGWWPTWWSQYFDLYCPHVQFVVWVVANMTAPEFVSPTPVSQHVYTVYAGSKLSISLAARPSPQSPPTTWVVPATIPTLYR